MSFRIWTKLRFDLWPYSKIRRELEIQIVRDCATANYVFESKFANCNHQFGNAEPILLAGIALKGNVEELLVPRSGYSERLAVVGDYVHTVTKPT